jgi:hypothetical protein
MIWLDNQLQDLHTCSQPRGASYPQTPLLDDEAAANEDAAADSQPQPYALLFHD